jgi:hypothetical protein
MEGRNQVSGRKEWMIERDLPVLGDDDDATFNVVLVAVGIA